MRDDWKFQFTAQEVLDAATKIANYHRGRQQHWEARAVDLEQAIRNTGVELREIQQSGGPRFEARVDTALGNELAEAKQKAGNHRAVADRYTDWGFALSTLGATQVLSLDVADVSFFELGRP